MACIHETPALQLPSALNRSFSDPYMTSMAVLKARITLPPCHNTAANPASLMEASKPQIIHQSVDKISMCLAVSKSLYLLSIGVLGISSIRYRNGVPKAYTTTNCNRDSYLIGIATVPDLKSSSSSIAGTTTVPADEKVFRIVSFIPLIPEYRSSLGA